MIKTLEERAEATAEIGERFNRLKKTLSERARRLLAASEAMAFGWGGIAAVAKATGISQSTIRQGIEEVEGIESGTRELLSPERSRRMGGGRKKLTELRPDLLPTLKELVESTTRGDPESALLWTARSQQNLVMALRERGFRLTMRTVAGLLQELGYCLQGNRKRLEGAQHPDRNAQFEHLNERVRRQLEAGEPAISVDTKKKELVGEYKNGGRELRAQGDPELVEVYDFLKEGQSKAAPYGVHALGANEAWVSGGISHDTSEFAVEAIRTWWKEMGQAIYPTARTLLISADGGSNGYRVRLWKVELQRLADELQMTLQVCHLPPGTIKWNRIEHRHFSFISQNWRGKPLITHQVIVELIGATKTRTGLRVECRLDEKTYVKGRRISD